IVVAHRPSALANIDQVLVMSNGTVHAFGSREQVLANVLRPSPPVSPRPASLAPIPGVAGHA
ncbi:MAG: type I secretion system permease/ATPase, partial [Mesorhizobium sp.]